MERPDEGNPHTYYERIALTDEEARERVNRTGDPDAEDAKARKPNSADLKTAEGQE